MHYKDFLQEVLPEQGMYCIIGVRDTAPKIKQSIVATIEQVDSEVRNLLGKDYNVYFGCAKYEGRRRTQQNATYFKSLWLDIDCGVNKFYKTQSDGMEALVEFSNAIGLPRPAVVSSGFGLHCYWVFEESVSKEEWKPVADRLKALCKQHDFKIDVVVPADAARVLRVPGTLNFKTKPPLTVDLIAPPNPHRFAKYKEILGVTDNPLGSSHRREMSALTKKLMGNKNSSFRKIVERTISGTGCAQLANTLTNQKEIPEPLWRAGLSIARNCDDWEIAIHIISSEHPQYSPQETEEKASRLLDKPYRCEVFEELEPEHCANCSHRGKIKSPIVLGAEIVRSEDSEIVLDDSGESIGGLAGAVSYAIPPIPFPYMRAKNGGIYREEKDEPAKLLYENDLFVIKRMEDRGRGELALARLHLPKDKPKEFIIPLSVMGSKEEVRKLLAMQGCIVHPSMVDGLMGYLISCTKAQQMIMDVEVLRQQMGWCDNDTKFILGDQEIGVTEIRYSPPSETTASVAHHMHARGSIEEWKRVVSVYNREGFESHAFSVLAALGSPLMKFTHYKGAFINLINSESGTGKTTILRVINSFYGEPSELLSKESDTLAHKLFRLGVLNNLPFTADELTNMKPEAISTLLYAISQGQGPGRMQSQVNMERKNDTTWSSIGIGSGNASMAEVLATFKTAAAGEVMRLLEYRISATGMLDKQEAYELFELKLSKNYGMAGPIYIQWVLANLDKVLGILKGVQQEVDAKCNFNNKDRYWSAVIACNITGGLIARKLGLIDWDLDRILDWVTNSLVPDLRHNISDQKISYSDFLGQFMNQNIGNALVIKDLPDPKNLMQTAPLLEPRNQLLLRIETDTKNVYIATKTFREYCTQNKVICADMLKILKGQGVYMGEVKKRLGKGTKIVGAPAINTYLFKYELDESMLGDLDENTHD